MCSGVQMPLGWWLAATDLCSGDSRSAEESVADLVEGFESS